MKGHRGKRVPAPTLKIGSHNVRGLRTNLPASLLLWSRAGYQIVLLQETHLTESLEPSINVKLEQEGWTPFWAHGTSASCGVAILVRSYLIRSQTISVRSTRLVDSTMVGALEDAAGRALSMRLQWAGHDLDIVSVYLPNDPGKQRAFLSASLAPLLNLSRNIIVGGDFNFVSNPALDRPLRRTAAGIPLSTDSSTSQVWQDLFSSLTDTYRRQHPTRRGFTYAANGAVARLDRIYTTSRLEPFITSANIFPHSPSDHDIASVSLLGKIATQVQRGQPRIRLDFARQPERWEAFLQELQTLVAGAPTDDIAFVIWWPSFKRKVSILCHRHQHLSRRQAQEELAALEELLDLARADIELGYAADTAPLIAARQAWARAHETVTRAQRRGSDSFHQGETPSPGLTAALTPPRAAREIAGLLNESARVVQGAAAATVAAKYYAEISRSQPVDPAAQTQVLDALATGPTLAPSQAEVLGCTTISPEEIMRALRKTHPGKAPGLDGIPPLLYRRARHVMAPLLCKLFSAIGATGQTPQGFLDGRISLIYKGEGDKALAKSYRPITLLNTDYRLLAKVLALRLSPCLGDIIDPEQTAFVRGRSIGENILLLQCLPQLLATHGDSAAVVFCDFNKAYDTVNRDFLYSCMETLGVGSGFIAWAKLLLSNTKACAVVNGHFSGFSCFEAGVRQGCPLAPLLYLFIAQALLRHLKHHNVGLKVGSRLLTAAQFADDTEVLLPSLAAIPSFLQVMDTFRAASGQSLNLTKTKALPIGAPPLEGAPPATISGLAVVPAAKALGIDFQAWILPPKPDMDAKMTSLQRNYKSIARLQLSIFGRAFSSASYGISKLLYLAEYCGLSDELAAQLDHLTTKLIARGLSPDESKNPRKSPHHLSIRRELLWGHPRRGGFGAQPWREQINARHAVWAVRLITGSPHAPWIYIARALLRVSGMPLLGALSPRTPIGASAPIWWQHALSRVPEPLRRCLSSLRSLPAPQPGPEPCAGPWCLAAPLWGDLPALTTTAGTFDARLASTDLSLTQVQTVSDLFSTLAALQGAPPNILTPIHLWAERFNHQPPLQIRAMAHAALLQVLAALPATWLTEAWGTYGQPDLDLTALEEAALAALTAGQHWLLGNYKLPLAKAHVGHLTSLLSSNSHRYDCLTRYVHLARGTLSPSPPAAIGEHPSSSLPSPSLLDRSYLQVLGMLRRIWRLPMPNKRKEPLWRLVHNGIATADRFKTTTKPCVCGATMPGRKHYFWSCPIAAHLIQGLSSAAGSALSCESIWLARAPSGVYQGVWDVVCALAIAALDRTRSRGYKTLLETNFDTANLPDETVETLARAATLTFWEYLADFTVSCDPLPQRWHGHIDSPHPFLSCSPSGSLQITHAV